MDNRKIKVTLAKAHIHGGMQYAPGDVIEVTESQAERLKKTGTINSAEERKRGSAEVNSKKKEDKQ